LGDPDQNAGTRAIALGFTALDTATGGEGKAVGKSAKLLDSTFARAAEHALEESHFIGKTADEIVTIAKDTYKNFDIKATIKNVKKYYYNAKENILFINNPKQPTIFSPKDGLDYLKRAIKTDILKGGGLR